MSARGVFGFLILLGLAGVSWFINRSLQPEPPARQADGTIESGYYLKDARILGTGEDGRLLYRITAISARQNASGEIVMDNVEIKYTPSAGVQWTLIADSATLQSEQRNLSLSGNVRALSEKAFDGKDTEITTSYLEFDPDTYRAQTDARVRIRIGQRSLGATGMLALLKENKLSLKSNVSGKFLP